MVIVGQTDVQLLETDARIGYESLQYTENSGTSSGGFKTCELVEMVFQTLGKEDAQCWETGYTYDEDHTGPTLKQVMLQVQHRLQLPPKAVQ